MLTYLLYVLHLAFAIWVNSIQNCKSHCIYVGDYICSLFWILHPFFFLFVASPTSSTQK
ncbi:hypothetical protein BDB00DRAFT_804757 [Zychaea mexicana]|uniref:uncharacterized protein n=1 Tax=Zychaea mexicana TaxID=64656 RepID=UPI0022FEBCD6|nr:uncharacterized protein BDB00DRAFT_804757 [Zychaea mexicana]KAI9497493.1 hypothetical protein BDB00DRAFT_804757 [Zychaea mexicana]